MGFACIRVFPLPEEAPGFVLTFGPYCPPEGAGSIETSALEGLARLKVTPDAAFTKALMNVPVLPAVTVPGIVEWTVDALQELWVRLRESDRSDRSDRALDETEPDDSDAAVLRPRRRAKSHAVSPDPYRAGPIAAALAGGAQNQARALVRAVLDETRSGQRARVAVKRARMLALLGAVLEAAERAEVDTALCRARLPQFLEEVERARTDLRLADAAMRLLSILKRKVARDALVPKLNLGTSGNEGYAELNAILLPRLLDGITLNEVAAKLGQHPTAITHRLQRKFGMSFSEYIGRLRVDRAKELLRRTRLNVTEVARRVGINDTSNFAKLFHKFESMSPVKYREQFGKKR
jgi:AraC-like DNA-binding protein